MKKNIVAIFALAIISVFTLTACNSTPSITGKFKDDEYIVSIDEAIDFYDYLEVSGAEASDIVLSSSNEEILKSQENGTFVGETSGEAYIFANYQNRVLASVKVVVKYKQALPKNFVLSEEGTYSWDKSFVTIDGQENYASNYEIAYSLIEENIDPNRIEFTYQNLETNSFTFDKKGSYYVKVRALSSNKYIDNSDFSNQVVVNYGVMGVLEDITIQNSDFGQQRTIISWKEKEGAVYDVYINGIKFYENFSQNYFEYDFSRFDAGSEIRVSVISSDIQEKLMSTKTTFDINKLESPVLKYNYLNNDGFVNWESVENALGYKLRTYNVKGMDEQYDDFKPNDNFTQYLKGKSAGIYNFAVIAVGGNSENGIFVSSDVIDTMIVAKLDIPKVEITFGNKNATLKFEENEYIKNYRIEWNNKSIVYSTDSGLETEIDLSDLSAGLYEFKITALPTVENGVVKPVVDGEYSTSNVINSDEYIFEFYILDEFSEISHNLNDEENISIITVDRIENANYYSLFVNDQTVDSNKYQFIENGENILILLNDLSSFKPKNGKYILKVVAGRKDENNADVAPSQEIVKELEILPIVDSLPSEEQENGSYKWQVLEQDAVYDYQVFKTEKDYVVEPNEKPIASGQTTEGKINETLEFGYYVINIISKTTNTNEYLDSNYYDKSGYFTANFIVNKKIETPSVIFENKDGLNKLIIDTVEFGGGYDIYVDGKKDGSVMFGDSHPESAVYDRFEEQFEIAKDYTITIIAHSGTMYDKFLHIPSDEFELVVTKLALPTFEIVEDFNEDNNLKKDHEYLQVNMIDHADYPVIKLDNVVVNTEKQTRIDMIDYSVYDTEFNISIQYISDKTSEDNHYYLDSQLKEVPFKRVSAPTSISYSKGILTFENNENGKIDKYFITLTTVNSVNSNYYTRFFTDDNSLTFDFQAKINQLLESDENFKSAYKMAEYLQVEISSHVNGMIENVYHLPSANGTTVQGQNKLDIKKLEAPKIKFDSQSHILSWNSVSNNTTYDIYVDDTKMIQGFTSTSITVEELGNIDWLTTKNVYVKSYNKSFLDSDNSNSINIKKLQQVSSLNVANVDGEWIVSISLLSDTGNISEIQVNGSADNVKFTAGGNVASFKVSDFADVSDFNIQVIFKNSGNENYFLSSDVTKFTLENLEDNVFEVNLSDDTLSWNTIASDFIGANINPLIYTIKVTNQDKDYYIDLTDKSYSIQDIEKEIGVKLTENVQIQVIASVGSDYILTLQDGQAKGYYGQHNGQVIDIEKLISIDDVTVTVEDNMFEQTALSQKLKSSVILKWNDLWRGIDNINFKVVIEQQEGEPLSLILKNGDEHEDYKLFLEDGVYILKLGKEIVKSGINDISLTVLRTGSINSEEKNVQVERLQKVGLVSISDSGILTIEDQQNSSYLIQISIEDKVIEKSLIFGDSDFTKVINLMSSEFLVGKLGAYTVKVIAFDNDMKKAPSQEEFLIEGYKLEGIENIELSDEGNILITLIIDDFSNLVFTAKVNSAKGEVIREFTPIQTDENSNQFYVAMIDIVHLFKDVLSMQAESLSFDFTVRKAGSIDADWVRTTFNYAIDTPPVMKREASIVNDYIIFSKGQNDNTVGFRAIVTSKKIEEPETPEVTAEGEKVSYVKFFSAEETIGYWKESADGKIKEFVTEKDPSSSAVYTECYGILVSELLKELKYGEIVFEITRIGKENQTYYQYNQHTFQIYKLNGIEAVGGMAILDNKLSWNWNQVDDGEYADIFPTAYYVTFIEEKEGKTFQVISYKKVIDLSNIGLVPNKTYNINIIALSNDTNIICSNPSESKINVKKYNSPISVEVKNGKIAFNEEQMRESQFMQDISNFFENYTSQSGWTEKKDSAGEVDMLYNTMVKNEKEYFAPINFMLEDFGNNDTRVTLKFTEIIGGAATNTVYKISGINAAQLFPDFEIDYLIRGDEYLQKSYIELLFSYYQKLNGSSNEIQIFKNFVESLNKANKGIGDDGILIDDLNRDIPAGEYFVSITHTGLDSNISSDDSEVYRMYLSYAPQTSIQNENIEGKSQYTINVKPVSTYNVETVDDEGNPATISKIVAQKYKMMFRYMDGVDNKEKTFTLMILYNGNEWEISYNDKVLTTTEDVLPIITNIETGAEIPDFKINMSSLKYYEEMKTLIKINTLMKVDIFAYLPAEYGYTTNGKSTVINVNYLDLLAKDIKFDRGNFSISGGLDDSYEVLVRYKRQGEKQDSFTSSFVEGIAELNFKDAGAYDYIILSINGSISKNTMNIESDTYAIKNIYKLSQPELTTENNDLVIKYNSQNTNNMSTLQFMMGNNISLSEDYDGDDTGYYYTSLMTRNDNGSAYYVGSRNNDGTTKYESELLATSFSAYFNGNTGSFEDSDEKFSYGDQSADHLLIFVNKEGEANKAILTSDTNTINAKMLPSASSSGVENGNYNWGFKETEGKTFADDSQNEGHIVYKIDVIYYVKSLEDENVYNKQKEETYYSQSNVLSSSYISEQFDYYKINVTAMVGIETTSDNRNAVKTIEDKYYTFGKKVYYTDSTTGEGDSPVHVLRSQDARSSGNDYITRTKSPELSSESSRGVADGKIMFRIDKNLYSEDVSERLAVIAEYSMSGKDYSQKLTGQFEFKDDSNIGHENIKYVYFTPDEGQLNGINFFNIKVYLYSGNQLNSKPLVIEKVYKLANVSSSYYNVGLDDNGQTYMDFDEYFKQNSVNNDYSCYKIVITITDEENNVIQTVEISVTGNVILDKDKQEIGKRSDRKFIFSDEMIGKVINIQVVDAQGTEQLNAKRLLFSDVVKFNIYETSVEDLSLSWNEDKVRFEWNWNSDNESQYQFYTNLLISGVNEKEFTNNYYYMPKRAGKVQEFVLRARIVNIDEKDSSIYLFSNAVSYTGEIDVKLFSGGTGEEDSPYLINNTQDFLNISKRNEEGQKFYFKLNSNLTITDTELYNPETFEKIIDIFYGELDGNGKTITFTSTSIFDMEEYENDNIAGLGTLTINKYSSLFEKIENGGVIKNLVIDYKISYNKASDNTIIFAPVALYNNGTVDNVTLNDMSIDVNGNGKNIILVGGIVAINNGTIKNSQNIDELECKMFNKFDVRFGYGGIALFNNTSATISNCLNKGTKTITMLKTGSIASVAGIALSNEGKISVCGNDSNIVISSYESTAVTAYVSGIVMTSSYGTLEYVYNNGTITKGTNYIKLNSAGIAYEVTMGTINSIVETGGIDFFSKVSRPNVKGTLYAKTGSGSLDIPTVSLKEVSIKCGSTGFKLVVTSVDGAYVAKFTKE